MIDGRWAPGAMIPSEQQIAAELGVSPGTARKALDALAQESLLVRQQGRGPFVAVPEEGKLLFQFFHLMADDGERIRPDSFVHSLKAAEADARIAMRLGLRSGGKIWRIERVRLIAGKPLVSEVLAIPQSRFPAFGKLDAVPNNLYALYSSRFGITIARVAERLKAVAAGKRDAARLECTAGAPLLEVERTAFALDGTAVEWRLSRCVTEQIHYAADLR